MTENLTDAEIEALEARLRFTSGSVTWGEVAMMIDVKRALAELREWRAQFGPDPSRWHKVWEVGTQRVEGPRLVPNLDGPNPNQVMEAERDQALEYMTMWHERSLSDLQRREEAEAELREWRALGAAMLEGRAWETTSEPSWDEFFRMTRPEC